MKKSHLNLAYTLVILGLYGLICRAGGNSPFADETGIGAFVALCVFVWFVFFRSTAPKKNHGSLHRTNLADSHDSGQVSPESGDHGTIIPEKASPKTLGNYFWITIGIILLIFGTYTLIKMIGEEQGAGLAGVITGYLIVVAVSALLIYYNTRKL